jgi:hypothetical protein
MANRSDCVFRGGRRVTTVVYVVFTLRLWESTEKTARAAGKSAEAAAEPRWLQNRLIWRRLSTGPSWAW